MPDDKSPFDPNLSTTGSPANLHTLAPPGEDQALAVLQSLSGLDHPLDATSPRPTPLPQIPLGASPPPLLAPLGGSTPSLTPPGANPVAAMLGRSSANPLDEFFDPLRLDTLPEGRLVALIADWSMAADPFGELDSKMLFRVEEGELVGKEFEEDRKVTTKSFLYLKRAITVAAGQPIADAAEVFDHHNNCAGPIRNRVVGAIVEIRVRHREVNDRVYINIDVVKLLQPAPNGASRSANS